MKKFLLTNKFSSIENNKKGRGGIALIMFLCAIFIYLLIFGVQIKTTENGKHTGYITAIETSGIIFKTNSVYFKTETESSQEDVYCVIDNKVKEELSKLQVEKKRVNIIYENYIWNGLKKCDFGDIAIIKGVEQ